MPFDLRNDGALNIGVIIANSVDERKARMIAKAIIEAVKKKAAKAKKSTKTKAAAVKTKDVLYVDIDTKRP